MIVPRFWAEGRVQHREKGRQITVRRFGWSDVSEHEAQTQADARAWAALERLVRGEKLPRREPKVPYNGAEGVPIREEIVARYGETIITRNAYGARCLNTPDVLFVDIDFHSKASAWLTFLIVALFCGGALGLAPLLPVSRMAVVLFGFVFLVTAIFAAMSVAQSLHWVNLAVRGGSEQIVRDRIARFIEQNASWHLRLYRTPAGLRVLAMHRTFSPDEPAVAECFRALGADAIYTRMCLKQRCFRARVSPKPWRIGIPHHMRPRPGVWPVAPERMALRTSWIEEYERAARGYAACRYLESIGSPVEHQAARAVKDLHDELCRATSTLPIA